MSAITASYHQVGQSSTNNLNIVLSTDASGNLIINKGTYGGTLTPIGSISTNNLTLPVTLTAVSTGQSAFTLPSVPGQPSVNGLNVSFNGFQLTPTTDFLWSPGTTTLTLTANASARTVIGDELVVSY